MLDTGPPARLGSFIGRQAERAALHAALERSMGGQGQLVMLAGEAGIGKTRLAQKLSEEAGRREVLVLWGRCFEEPGAPPYWPWIQIIRGYLYRRDDESLRAAFGAGAAEVAGVVPELAERLGYMPRAARSRDGDHARFELFDAITLFLQRAARAQPLLLVFDNLHWADPTSLRLLEFVAFELAETPLLVLGTFRQTELSRQHPLSETLGELMRVAGFQRLHLSGLSREETEQFLAASAAGATTPAPAFVTTIYERTEGNPLFLVETVRYLCQEGRLRAEESGLGKIPAGIREVIGKRLNRLSVGCCRLLSVAACFGRIFEFEPLTRLIPESSEEILLSALEEALAANVIEPLPQADRYQFSHILVRETLYDELPAPGAHACTSA